ncbi:MAG: alpha/beta hydrolase [Desulfatiglans sp.]|jgi:pimeloyl-ACP methyl ester carboxylesterase|nr:alpha/beta hydrolase [Desulfatiglans sp.]
MRLLIRIVIFIMGIQSYVFSDECVILLHGLARSSSSFNRMESALKEKGYFTVNYNYPSRKYGIEKLAKESIDNALVRCPENSKIHFVTHSLGGILVRQYLSTGKIKNLGRVVMLGPPNKGSQVVDKLKKVPGFVWFNGPAVKELGTDSMSIPASLGPSNIYVGIIAGTKSINPILSSMLPDPDDGKVSVDNTKLAGMTDHITLPVAHPFLMKNDEVIREVICFLQNGKFSQKE